MSSEVEIRIKSKDESGAGFASAEKRVSSLKKSVQAGAVAIGAAGVAAGGLFAKGLSDNLNIEAANDKLAAQLNLNTFDAEKAGKAAGNVYKNAWGGSIGEVNDAIASINTNLDSVADASQADIERMATQALALAQTFNVDVNDATRAAGKLIKSGLAKDATEAFDIITKGFQSGLDSSGDFLDTLNEYSPQFAKLGIEGKDALDILKVGLQAGARDTDAVADAFKEFSIRSIEGSKNSQNALKDLGFSVEATEQAFAKGGETARIATMKTIQAIQAVKDPVKQNAIGVALFGTQWEDTVREILPALANFEGAVGDVDGATQKMIDTVGDNGAAKIEGMKRSFEAWTQEMASTKGPLGDIAAATSAFGQDAIMMAGSIGQLAAGFVALGGASALAAVKTVAMAGVSAVVSGATAVWTAAQWALNVALTANPIGIIIVAIAALVAAIILAYRNSDTFREIVDEAFRAVGEAAVWLGDRVGDLISWFSDLPGNVMSALEAFPGMLLGFFHSALMAVAFAIGYYIGTIVRFWIELPGQILGAIKSIPGLVVGTFRKMWSNAVAVFHAGVATVRVIFTQVVPMLARLGASAASAAFRAFSRIPGLLKSAISAAPGLIKGVFSGAGSWLVGAGKAMLQGAVNGIKSGLGWAVSEAKSAAKSMVRGFQSALGIASPSKVMANEVGRHIPTGIAMGIKSASGAVKTAVSQVSDVSRMSVKTPLIPGRDMGGGGEGTIRLTADDAEVSRFLMKLIQKAVRTQYQGNVQLALGGR